MTEDNLPSTINTKYSAFPQRVKLKNLHRRTRIDPSAGKGEPVGSVMLCLNRFYPDRIQQFISIINMNMQLAITMHINRTPTFIRLVPSCRGLPPRACTDDPEVNQPPDRPIQTSYGHYPWRQS